MQCICNKIEYALKKRGHINTKTDHLVYVFLNSRQKAQHVHNNYKA